MSNKGWKRLASGALAGLMVFGMFALAAAQGRGRGGGGGQPAGVGGGRPDGLGRAIDAGRPADPFSVGSERSRGRNEPGMERAGEVRRNREVTSDSRRPDDRELSENSGRYRALASRLGYENEASLRAAYDSAANRNVSFGEFVAAHMLSSNLSRRGNLTDAAGNPLSEGAARAAILSALREGDSIGEALRGLGLSKSAAREAEKDYKRQLKESQMQ